MFSNLCPQPLFETDGAEDPGRILDKRKVVENTDHLFFNISDSCKKIDQLSKGLGVELNT